MPHTSTLAGVVVMAIAAMMTLVVLSGGVAGQSTVLRFSATHQIGSTDPSLKVPCGGSIQGAINGAHSGETILLAACTYTQQFTVDKSVTITGSGVGKTTIESPAAVGPDAFGNLWTIEIGHGASVTLSEFTLLETLQCIPLAPAPFSFPYAGGGIGVGGSATLDLQSAVITTSGGSEGAGCPGGVTSYGTGVGFGLDYALGGHPPSASKLVGTGEVFGVSISGFGFDGAAVSIGGQLDSPAGSSALISNDRIFTSADDVDDVAGISLGYGNNASSATVQDSVLSGQLSYDQYVIDVESGSSATIDGNAIVGMPDGAAIDVAGGSTASIAENSIVAAEGGEGIILDGGTATITSNLITGITGIVSGAGIYMIDSSATISFNSIGIFECEYVPPAAPYVCGPSPVNQFQELQDFGILDYGDAGLGTTIANNYVFQTDIGIFLLESGGACPGCVVEDNLLVNNVDYGLGGFDGDYSFGPNSVVGGLYGVGAIAADIDTTVTLAHVSIIGESVGPFYIESDYGYTATIVGT